MLVLWKPWSAGVACDIDVPPLLVCRGGPENQGGIKHLTAVLLSQRQREPEAEPGPHGAAVERQPTDQEVRV